MTVVNIRGNNGSGKTSIVKAFFDYPSAPLFGALGPSRPEGYRIELGGAAPLFVIGPYQSKTGGVDSIGGLPRLIPLLEKYVPRGHVLFEGVILSTSYGALGRWLVPYKDKTIIAYMDTPLKTCMEAVGARSGDDATYGRMKFKEYTVAQSRLRFKAEGFRVEDISREDGFAKVQGWLHDHSP